jgi:DNA-binding IclR family transcriptional regulator
MSKIVNRTLDVFELFASQKRPLPLTDLMKLLDIPLSSCHDVVRALQDRGYLHEVRPRGGFYPTARMLDVARTIVDHDPIAQRAGPVLDRLSKTLGASASLAVARGVDVTYLAVSLPEDPLRFTVSVGSRVRNLYATSAGKAFLGSLPEDDRAALVATLDLAPLTRATLTSRDELLADIKAGEMRGWFENREESVEDALTLSCSLRWNGSLYILTLAGTLKRMERQMDVVVMAMRQAARELAG